MWLVDPVGKKMQGAPISETARNELLRWFSGKSSEESKFEPPQYEGDAISRQLDSITLEEHLMQRHGLSQETIRTFLSPVEGGGSGLGPDALSAFCDYAADLLHPMDDGSGEAVQMFPGGNTTIARLMVKTLYPRVHRWHRNRRRGQPQLRKARCPGRARRQRAHAPLGDRSFDSP